MFGGQTVKFVTLVEGAPDRNNIPALTRTLVAVSGCRFRPLKATEKVELATVATEVWQLTAPPAQGVLEASAVSEVLYDGTSDPDDDPRNVYQIVGGVQPFTDMGGTPFKVTVLCQRQS